MTNYRNGKVHEYHARDDLIARGYWCQLAAGSKGAADIVALRPGEVLLVSVKRSNPQIPPAERVVLLEAALQAGGVPLVAHKPPRKPVTYRKLTGAGPKDWQLWSPSLH